jgi:hypothetical protein
MMQGIKRHRQIAHDRTRYQETSLKVPDIIRHGSQIGAAFVSTASQSVLFPEFAVHRHGDDNTLIRHTFLPKKTAS